MISLIEIPTAELERELERRRKKNDNVLANIQGIIDSLQTITTDYLDSYCAIDQYKAEIFRLLEEIKTKMREL